MTLWLEAQLLKLFNIPRLQPGGPQHHPSPRRQRFVERANLSLRVGTLGIKPIHRVHDHGDGQCPRTHPCDNLVDFIGVDPQTVKGVWMRELDVRTRL